MNNPSSTSCVMHKVVPLALIIAKAILFMYIVTRSVAFPHIGNPFNQNTYVPAVANSPTYQRGGFGPFLNPQYGQNNPPGQSSYSSGYGGNFPSFNSPPYGPGAGMGERFYGQTCPAVERIVLGVMYQAVQNETRLQASILRLHFHDFFENESSFRGFLMPPYSVLLPFEEKKPRDQITILSEDSK